MTNTTTTQTLPTHVMERGASWIGILELSTDGTQYWGNDGCPIPLSAGRLAAALARGRYVDAAPFIAYCDAHRAGTDTRTIDTFWAEQA